MQNGNPFMSEHKWQEALNHAGDGGVGLNGVVSRQAAVLLVDGKCGELTI